MIPPPLSSTSSDTSTGPGLSRPFRRPEWPTLVVALVCYAGWVAALVSFDFGGPWLTGVVLTAVLTLHSSFQHEIIHGHPFRNRRFNDLLGCLPVGLFMPFERFRDLHLRHHRDHLLTDPYDDPESNYLSSVDWASKPAPLKLVLRFNNTLFGRMAIGPTISLSRLYREDFAGLRRDEHGIRSAYLLHGIGLFGVATVLLLISTVPWWLYVLCAYLAMSLLKIRTFLEHCAHEDVAHRTAIVEDQGPLSALFLNNNLHAVHHAYPGLPWYELPQQYRQHRSKFLRENNGYAYQSYWIIARQYLFRTKDSVAHPLPMPELKSASSSWQFRTRIRSQ